LLTTCKSADTEAALKCFHYRSCRQFILHQDITEVTSAECGTGQ